VKERSEPVLAKRFCKEQVKMPIGKLDEVPLGGGKGIKV